MMLSVSAIKVLFSDLKFIAACDAIVSSGEVYVGLDYITKHAVTTYGELDTKNVGQILSRRFKNDKITFLLKRRLENNKLPGGYYLYGIVKDGYLEYRASVMQQYEQHLADSK
jgi:hypothetical protein